jgi:hypothetical protein
VSDSPRAETKPCRLDCGLRRALICLTTPGASLALELSVVRTTVTLRRASVNRRKRLQVHASARRGGDRGARSTRPHRPSRESSTLRDTDPIIVQPPGHMTPDSRRPNRRENTAIRLTILPAGARSAIWHPAGAMSGFSMDHEGKAAVRHPVRCSRSLCAVRRSCHRVCRRRGSQARGRERLAESGSCIQTIPGGVYADICGVECCVSRSSRRCSWMSALVGRATRILPARGTHFRARSRPEAEERDVECADGQSVQRLEASKSVVGEPLTG